MIIPLQRLYITLYENIAEEIEKLGFSGHRLCVVTDSNVAPLYLEEVKRVAIQELGMRYAEEGQIVTFDGEGSDYVRQTGEIPD